MDERLNMKGAHVMEGERFIEPLMYIEQPDIQKPKAYMQEEYFGRSISNQLEPKVEQLTEENTEEYSKESSFKALNIDDKIDYLVNLPSEVARIRCEVITEEKNYRGTMVDDEGESITIRVIGRGTMAINRDDIKEINLIGF